MAIQWQKVDLQVKQWLREASIFIKQSFEYALDIDYKQGPNDLVTNIDKETEAFFIDKIRTHYPDHRILGEEGHGHELATMDGIVWVIDPIDGTMNFVRQQSFFAISIGIFADGIGQIGLIYDVTRDELFHCRKGQGAFMNDHPLPVREAIKPEKAILDLNASWLAGNPFLSTSSLKPLVRDVRGTRSYGTAAIALAYVACGRLDGYLSMHLAPWDVAAGKILIEEVGGRVTRIDEQPLDILQSGTVLAAETHLHDDLMQDYLRQGLL